MVYIGLPHYTMLIRVISDSTPQPLHATGEFESITRAAFGLHSWPSFSGTFNFLTLSSCKFRPGPLGSLKENNPQKKITQPKASRKSTHIQQKCFEIKWSNQVKVGLATDWLQQMDQLGVPDVRGLMSGENQGSLGCFWYPKLSLGGEKWPHLVRLSDLSLSLKIE